MERNDDTLPELQCCVQMTGHCSHGDGMQMTVHTPSTMHPLPRRNQLDKQSSQTGAERMRSEATQKTRKLLKRYSSKL